MFEFDQKRIDRLRESALFPCVTHERFNLYFYLKYSSSKLPTAEARYAEAYAYAFGMIEPQIDDDELIVGKVRHPYKSDEERAEGDRLVREVLPDLHANYGQESHLAIDYDLLLQKGIIGVEKRINELLSENAHPESEPFYRGCLVCLDAVRKFSEKYAEKAEEMMKSEEDGARKAELALIAKTVRRVPYYPATSFFEAVQSVSFITYCLSVDPICPFCRPQYQLGRPDRYLLPFYEKDIKDGVITKENARMILDLLGIQINNRVPSGLSSGYMVGGRDANGCVVANDLTELGMQVIDDIRLVYPAVGLCYTSDMPERFLDLATEILSHGRSHPAIFGEDTIAQGLAYYGVSPEECRNYIHSTCVEITPIAASNIWVASPYTNMAQLLLDILDREYGSMQELLDRYYSHLSERIKANLDAELSSRKMRAERGHHPLLSCFTNDCLAKGTDCDRFGGRYNWIMPSFVGIANLVDSFYVIEKEMFCKDSMTFAKLREILENNFEGCENIRKKFANHYAKYGNDVPEVDAYAAQVTEFLVKECEKYRGFYPGFRLVPSVFCWIMHTRFGVETGATPDGRKAGFPLGDGSGPRQGCEKNGPTASVISSTSWEHKKLIGGVAVNLKFSKSIFNERSRTDLKSIIKTYIARGGFEVQINVVDTAALREAVNEPEKYRDLVVRIGGYSDYFVRLCPEMQAEVILRTEHGI